jgi:hypothetical protein
MAKFLFLYKHRVAVAIFILFQHTGSVPHVSTAKIYRVYVIKPEVKILYIFHAIGILYET